MAKNEEEVKNTPFGLVHQTMHTQSISPVKVT